MDVIKQIQTRTDLMKMYVEIEDALKKTTNERKKERILKYLNTLQASLELLTELQTALQYQVSREENINA